MKDRIGAAFLHGYMNGSRIPTSLPNPYYWFQVEFSVYNVGLILGREERRRLVKGFWGA